MTFQTQIYTSIAPGVAGDPATPDQMIYQAVNYTAETDCTIGNFCWPGTDAGTQAKPTAASGTPLGLVQRNLSYPNYVLNSVGTLVAPAGTTLTVALLGDFWVKTATDATVGQAVFAGLEDGSIKTGAVGATVSGAVETSWRVKTAGDANGMIIISNWGSAAAAT